MTTSQELANAPRGEARCESESESDPSLRPGLDTWIFGRKPGLGDVPRDLGTSPRLWKHAPEPWAPWFPEAAGRRTTVGPGLPRGLGGCGAPQFSGLWTGTRGSWDRDPGVMGPGPRDQGSHAGDMRPGMQDPGVHGTRGPGTMGSQGPWARRPWDQEGPGFPASTKR